MRDDLGELIGFLSSLDGGMRHQRGPVLVVREDGSGSDPDALLDEVEAAGVRPSFLRYSAPANDGPLIEEIAGDLERGVWPMLELRSEPSAALLELLKSLPDRESASGRLVVLVERDFVESAMQFPYFYELFGWICSV